ncbi:MAG: hypothetical protein GY799_12240 [Desulfobulbaceae bacterium]|nr:hypothetical protein [Desulfobulbaceae bacterium]
MATIADMRGAFGRFERLHKREVAAVLNDGGSNIVRNARKDHDFQTHSGALERSISHEVDIKNGTLTVFLDDRMTSVDNNRSYGVFQELGTYDGYKKTPMSPDYSHSTGRAGIKAEHFLWTPFKAEIPKLEAELQKVPARVARAMQI